jgi:hypothetical protein
MSVSSTIIYEKQRKLLRDKLEKLGPILLLRKRLTKLAPMLLFSRDEE